MKELQEINQIITNKINYELSYLEEVSKNFVPSAEHTTELMVHQLVYTRLLIDGLKNKNLVEQQKIMARQSKLSEL